VKAVGGRTLAPTTSSLWITDAAMPPPAQQPGAACIRSRSSRVRAQSDDVNRGMVVDRAILALAVNWKTLLS
jgi:hypothetical protein